ncbi:MAG: hypothetical protein AAF490_31905 [Chloroflexota bacterium]
MTHQEINDLPPEVLSLARMLVRVCRTPPAATPSTLKSQIISVELKRP